MIINHNLNSMNAHRNMSFNTAQTGKAMEKLSSGLRINRAGDDAAGLAISEKMRGQIRGLDQATRNAQDGISLIQTAEGALNETHDILQRMRELTVQSASDTNVDVDREAIKTELDELSAEVNRIADTTQFNKQTLLNGSFGVQLDASSTLPGVDGVERVSISGLKPEAEVTLTVTDNIVTATDADGNVQNIEIDTADTTDVSRTLNFDKMGFSVSLKNADLADLANATIVTGTDVSRSIMIGANENQKLDISISDMSANGLGVNALNVSTFADAQTSLTAIESAIEKVSSQRSTLGAWQNRLEHTINNLSTSAENLQAAESRIRDVDMAKEMMNFTKNNILNQAAQAMMSQSNQQPQAVLQLLR